MNHENVLIREDETAVPEAMTSGLYPLDWKTTEVKLGGGKLRAELRRPTLAELMERDGDLQVPVELAKDGSYKLPDPTATDDVDIRLFDQVNTNPDAAFAPRVKAAFIRGLYKREVYVDEEKASPFDSEITVFEEVGGDPPAFTIEHRFRQPTEEELRSYRRRMQTGEVKPGKRGRQQFITRSNLRAAIEFYDKWIVGIEGTKLDPPTDNYVWETTELAANVDPLIKRMVVQEFAGFILEALQD